MLRPAYLLAIVLSSTACYSAQHYRYPLSDAERAAVRASLSDGKVELKLHGREGVAGRAIEVDAERMRWLRSDGLLEATPLSNVASVSTRHVARGVVYGGLGGLLLGGVAGAVVGNGIENACIQRGHGDCGAPAITYTGMIVGAVTGAITLATVGALTASDTITFSH